MISYLVYGAVFSNLNELKYRSRITGKNSRNWDLNAGSLTPLILRTSTSLSHAKHNDGPWSWKDKDSVAWVCRLHSHVGKRC